MIFYTYVDRFDRKVSDSKNKPDEIFTNAGESIGIEYEYRTKEGIKNLVPCGKFDRQELIESYADECDVVKTIQKFIAGDTSVINPNKGTYGDFTNMPKTYAELYDHLEMCKKVFDSMPAKIKEEFDNSVESFWTQFGTERFDEVFDKFNGIESEKTNTIVEDVKESEVMINAE